MTADVEQGLSALQKETIKMEERLALPVCSDPKTVREDVIQHFLDRALQFGKASKLLCEANLEIPLAVLVRVLCEDLFIFFWIARSEEDAAEYRKAADAEATRLMRLCLVSKVARLRDTNTQDDVTARVLKQLDSMSSDSFKVEQLARDLGLSTLYEIIYRPLSVEVHGKGFGWFSEQGEGRLFGHLTAATGLIAAIGLVADNRLLRDEPTTAAYLLQRLGFATGGK